VDGAGYATVEERICEKSDVGRANFNLTFLTFLVQLLSRGDRSAHAAVAAPSLRRYVKFSLFFYYHHRTPDFRPKRTLTINN
jgi:hypothetical protein